MRMRDHGTWPGILQYFISHLAFFISHFYLISRTFTTHLPPEILFLLLLKCPYGQKVFLGFGISRTSKNIFKPKKVNSDAFAIKSSFEFPTLALPNEVDRVMKDW